MMIILYRTAVGGVFKQQINWERRQMNQPSINIAIAGMRVEFI